MLRLLQRGLDVPLSSPQPADTPERRITDEAAITARPSEDLRIDPLVAEGDLVAQGAPVARLRHAPEIALSAPMAGRVAAVRLGPGRRLSEMVFFHEPDPGRHRFDLTEPRALMQAAGLWRAIRSRPFGRMPAPDEVPAAIFVMATDTRPLAGSTSVDETALARGLAALRELTPGVVFLCGGTGSYPGVRTIAASGPHPHGLAGMQIWRHHPAQIGAPVWDISAADTAALGALLDEGMLPETRDITVAGPALREARRFQAQPGADLRALVHGLARPGPHVILSGSALDGAEAQWLAPRETLVTVMARKPAAPRDHWFRAALQRASRPVPLIPTAALDAAMGGTLAGVAMLRALASGDGETAVRLGALSLLEEDLALADYVTGARPRLASLLRAMLDRIEAEEVA